MSPSPPTSATRLWLPILALNVLIVVGVAVRVFTDPRVGNLQAYEFPETIEIEGWNFTDSESIKPVEKPEYEGSSYRAGRHYRYRQGRTPLDVEIRYVTETLGGVDLFTREHERFQGKADGEEIVALIRQSPETGAFAQLTYDDYAYISTCINPRGLSTVSPDQFQRNQELYDTVMGRVIPWLLGRDRWRDDRCLWTLMYMPLGDDPDQTQDQLEAAWRDWFDTWEGQFPPL
ncbi:cyanoexosortase A system-associated protein [Spirulina subsalsa]|uniref:cyanoexosortase A system-associated protein n=1 Tax=Spirulina subsalsa TaxID=54311 RepID=UPI00232E70B5|nr:cyanoexosortase A system-associated protein [Spirulina subsalsa]